MTLPYVWIGFAVIEALALLGIAFGFIWQASSDPAPRPGGHPCCFLAAEGGEPTTTRSSRSGRRSWSAAIAFAVLCFVLMKFVFPRMEQTFQARVDAIEGGIKRAEAAQAEANQLLEQYRAQLAEARTDAAKIRDDARADAEGIRQDILAKAREESDRIIAAGKDAARRRAGHHRARAAHRGRHARGRPGQQDRRRVAGRRGAPQGHRRPVPERTSRARGPADAGRQPGVVRGRGRAPRRVRPRRGAVGGGRHRRRHPLRGRPAAARAAAAPGAVRPGPVRRGPRRRCSAACWRGKVGADALDLLAALVAGRWSAPSELLDGAERLGVEALLASADAAGELGEVEDELFRFGQVVAGRPRAGRRARPTRSPRSSSGPTLVRRAARRQGPAGHRPPRRGGARAASAGAPSPAR